MSARLRIDESGEVRVEGDVGSSQRGRSYALLPATDVLLLGVDVAREAPTGHAPILAGDLAWVEFPEIVSLVAHTRISGVLRVYGPSATRAVVFGDGEVRGASSQRVSERLGEIAVRLGLIKRDVMEGLEREAGDPRRAGRLAVERGLLSERALWTAVQEHVTTVFQAILLETRGSFVLTDESVDESLTVPGLSAEGLLMEGVRRLDELRMLGSGDRSGDPARVLAAFNDAFRDIFATAADAGAGEALRRAADSVFEDDPSLADVFRGLHFSSDGELPADEVLPRLDAPREAGDREPSELLSDTLSTVILFLLFVAGEHLEPRVHQVLHSRVKARVSAG